MLDIFAHKSRCSHRFSQKCMHYIKVLRRLTATDGTINSMFRASSFIFPSFHASLTDVRVWMSAAFEVVQTSSIKRRGFFFCHTKVADFCRTLKPPIHILFYMKILVWAAFRSLKICCNGLEGRLYRAAYIV